MFIFPNSGALGPAASGRVEDGAVASESNSALVCSPNRLPDSKVKKTANLHRIECAVEQTTNIDR